MSKPMPSPNGTNHERAFLPSGSRVVAAYDAEPDDMPRVGELLNFLADKLEPDDLKKVKDMLGVEDDDAPASGASDAALRRYHAEARDMQRLGIIGDSEMVRRLHARMVPRSTSARTPVIYDDKNFPHRKRLK